MFASSPMSTAEVALFGTIAGAAIGAVSTSWLSEYYRRYRDTKATAYALAGELASHIEAFSDRVLENFQQLAEAARRGTFPGFPMFEASDLVYEQNIDKLGLLEGDIPQRLVTTYGRIRAGRGAMQQIARGVFKNDQPRIAAMLEYQIQQWKEHIRPDGVALVKELDRIGARGFWRSILSLT